MKCPACSSEMVKESRSDGFSTYGLPKTYKENYFFKCEKCASNGRLYAYVMIERRIYHYCGKWEIFKPEVEKVKVIYT